MDSINYFYKNIRRAKNKSTYFCSFIINSYLAEREFGPIEQQASSIFFDFIEHIDYCKTFWLFTSKRYQYNRTT
jgi:hypothetical protein